MASSKDATVVVFDVGSNTKEYDESKTQTFYEKSKRCLEAILQRKIFGKPKDEVALFFMGTESTANSLHTEHGGYDNISQALVLDPVDWKTLEFVQNNIDPPSEHTNADWLDALVVAMDYFKSLDLRKCSKKILLFTTFSTDVNSENVEAVIEGLKQLEIELIVVTKNVVNVSDLQDQSEFASFSQTMDIDRGKELILQIVKQANGVLCSLDEAVAKLTYIDKKQRRRMPWNSELTIGTTFAVKISAFIYVREEKELASWKTRTRTGDVCSMKTEHYHNDQLIEPEAVVTELVKGYLYGGVSVPYDDVSFDNGGKGLRCIGFTNMSTIHDEHLEGKSIWLVVPQKGFDVSAKRFSALIKAMRNVNLAIIARYTYRDGTAPKVMALFPHEDSMLMHELFYKDNIVTVSFPSLKSKKFTPSAEQFECMDKFIDSMDLTESKNQSESFKSLLDPGLQHAYRVIAHRALNPSDPLPKIDDDLMALVTPPKRFDENDELKALFPLKPVEVSNKEKFLQNIQNVQNELVDEAALAATMKQQQNDSDITEIGTLRPTEDFLNLLHRGERFSVLAVQLQNVIVNLVTMSMVSIDDKIHEALFAYRETAKPKAPYQYNEWISSLKDLLKEREKVSLWELIVKENLGLITANESEISTVTNEDAAAFYKADDFCTEPNRATDMDTGEANDLFDEL